MLNIFNRFVMFILFLLLGLIIFFVPAFLSGIPRLVYLAVIPTVFLFMVLQTRRKKGIQKYYGLLFAFFLAAFVNSLFIHWGGGTTVENKTFNVVVSTFLIVIPILLLHKKFGSNLGSIYLGKGNLRPGLVLGLATFLFFLVTAIPVSSIFGANPITLEQLISWAPLLAVFVSANSLREELLFRGIFLKEYEIFLGADTANILQAVIFALAHFSLPFSETSMILLVVVFFLGLGFGAVMQKTDSLLGAFLFHAGADIPFMLAVFSLI
jgi:membrane protease YdiL (CAAX protease family)